MHYSRLSIRDGSWGERHTIADGFHTRPEKDAAFEFEDLAVIFIN